MPKYGRAHYLSKAKLVREYLHLHPEDEAEMWSYAQRWKRHFAQDSVWFDANEFIRNCFSGINLCEGYPHQQDD